MRIGVALIGLGPASLPHAKSLLELEDQVSVRWAATRSPEKAAAFARTFPFRTTTDLDQAISDPGVDAVIVLTPPNAHLEVAARAFAAGKHVLVEKPLEVSVEKAAQLVEAGRRAGRQLGVVLQHRFRPASLRLRAALIDRQLGVIQFASMAVPWWRPQSYYDEIGRGTLARDGGGVLLTQAIHTLDLFRSFVGIRAVVAARASTTALHRMETEDFVTALVELGNGAPGSIIATTAFYPGYPERIEIFGEKGAATLIGGALTLDLLDGHKEEIASDGGTGSGASIMDFPHDAHRAVIADFLDAVRSGREPRVSGAEALESQRVISAIVAAGYSKSTN
jgi:predicted dehydrogenase